MIITGTAYWAKVFEPQPGFDKTKKEWSIDVTVDAETKKLLAKEGLGAKVKLSKDGEYEYISFKRPAVRADGTPSKPIEIVGPDAAPWTGGKIGNGSVVRVKFLVNETQYGGNKFKKPGILKLQVVKHVPHEDHDDEDFTPVDADGNESWS